MVATLTDRFASLPDLHQNPLYSAAMADIGWTTIGEPGSYLYIRKIGPIGIGKIQHPGYLDLSWLKDIRQKHHLLTTYVEPGLSQSNLGKIGISTEPFANSATSIIDLNQSDDSLLSSFKQKTRYNIGHTERKGEIKIVTKEFRDLNPQDLDIFKISRQNWSKRKGVIGYEESFITALLKHFGSSGWIHFAYRGTDCIATLMILKNGESAIYYSAFAESIGNKLFAPTLLTWSALKTAKKTGCTIFDFGGIYDERYKKMYKKWQGFTKFKEGFSPKKILYPPTQLLLGW